MDIFSVQSQVQGLVESARNSKDVADFRNRWSAFSENLNEVLTVNDDLRPALVEILFEQGELCKLLTTSFRHQGKSSQYVRADVLKCCVNLLQGLAPSDVTHASQQCISPLINYYSMEDSNTARVALLDLFLQMLEGSATGQLPAGFHHIHRVLMHSYQSNKKLSDTVKGRILEVVSQILTLAPELYKEDTANKDWLVQEACKVLGRTQDASSTKVPEPYLAGALAGVSAAVQLLEPGQTELVRIAYDHIRKAIQPEQVSKLSRYAALRSGLSVLAERASAFGVWYARDAHELLTHLASLRCDHPNKGVHEDADRALEAFFNQVSLQLQREDPNALSQAEQQAILQSLVGTLTKGVLGNPGARLRQISIAVMGVGCLAPAVRKFFGERGLTSLLSYLTPLVQRGRLLERVEDLQDARVEREVGLLASLAALLGEMEVAHEGILQMCCTVAERIMGSYLDLWPKQRPAVHQALVQFMLSVIRKGPALAGTVVQRVVTMILAHTVKPPTREVIAGPLATLSEGDVPDPPWMFYQHVWRALLLGEGLGHDKSVGLPLKVPPTFWSTLHRTVYDTLMRCAVDLLGNLNLSYHLKPPQSGERSGRQDERPIENQVQREAPEDLGLGSDWMVSSPHDMQAFLQLSGFLCALLPDCGPALFQPWAYLITVDLVTGSTARPLLSGYYHLLAATMKLCNQAGLFSKEQTMSSQGDAEGLAARLCTVVYREFLQEVLVACRRYKDDLLCSCLMLLLHAPPMVLSASQLAVPVNLALQAGLQYPPVGEVVVAALEDWERTQPDALRKILPHILSNMERYLSWSTTPGSGGGVPAPKTTKGPADQEVDGEDNPPEGQEDSKEFLEQQRARALAAKRKREAVKQSVEALVPRLQLWLGRRGQDVHQIVDAAAGATATASVSWDVGRKLGVLVPFSREGDPQKVYLDELLPRIAQLAESSSDRSTRVAACEFLHAITLWMVGTNARRPLTKDEEVYAPRPTSFHRLLSHMYPVVIRLAAGTEPVAQQMFSELLMSLVHWFTRNARREAADTLALLEGLLDGLSEEDNGAVREVSAMAVAEFLEWSSRHIPEEAGPGAPSSNYNAVSLLRRLFERLSHPEPYRRLGAALALGLCARKLRDMEQLVGDYLLEALHHCVQGLRLAEGDCPAHGTSRQISHTISALIHHCFFKHSHLLKHRDTRTRQGFASLADFLLWLWHYTRVPERACRRKCMLLMDQLCAEELGDGKGPGAESPLGPAAQWLLTHFPQDEQQSLDRELSRCLRQVTSLDDVGEEGRGDGTRATVSLAQQRQWLRCLEAVLDWCTWAMEERMIDVTSLPWLLAHGQGPTFLPELLSFLAMIPDISRAGPQGLEQAASLLPGCDAELRTMALALADLLHCLLDTAVISWESRDLQTYLLASFLAPAIFGFRPSEGEAVEQLVQKLLSLLRMAISKHHVLADSFLSAVQQLLGNLVPSGVGTAVVPIRADPDVKMEEMDHSSNRVWGMTMVTAARVLEGVGRLLVLPWPPDRPLLPPTVLHVMPQQCLEIAMKLPGLTASMTGPTAEGASGGPPEVNATAAECLRLAIQLRTPPLHLCEALLCAPDGPLLYQLYSAPLHKWAMFNADKVLPVILTNMADATKEESSSPSGRPHTAQMLLIGTLQGLVRYKVTSGRQDIRQGAFITSLMNNWPLLGPLWTTTSSADQKSSYLACVEALMNLDAPEQLSSVDMGYRSLLASYEELLNLRVLDQVHVRVRALQLLPSFLRFPPLDVQVLLSAVDRLTRDTFPVKSTEMQKFSPEALTYVQQLVAILDAAVALSSSPGGAGLCTSLLESLLSVLQELESPGGHLYQETVEARLLLVALGAWKTREEQGPSAATDVVPMCTSRSHSDLAIPDLVTPPGEKLLDFCWRKIFEVSFYKFPLRLSLTKHLLGPLLAYAPDHACSAFFQHRISQLLMLLEEPPAVVLGMGSVGVEREEYSLATRLCCYQILAIMYKVVSSEELTNMVLASVPGKNQAVVRHAVKDMRELNAQAPENQDLARDVRCSAFCTTCALMITTQHNVKFYTTALQGKNKSNPGDLWTQLLDTGTALNFPVESEGTSGARGIKRAHVAVQQVMSRIRADRRAATLASLTSLGSFDPSLTSLSAKMSASQFDMGEGEGPHQEGKVNAASLPIGGATQGVDILGTQDVMGPNEDPIVEAIWKDPLADDRSPATNTRMMDMLLSYDDDLDRNPCLLALVQLCEQASTLPSDVPGGLPGWMQVLHSSLTRGDVAPYTKMFIVKAILHVENRWSAKEIPADPVGEDQGGLAGGAHGDAAPAADPSKPGQEGPFARYAAAFFPAMVNAVLPESGVPSEEEQQHGNFHYLLRDMCLVFLNGWSSLFKKGPDGLLLGTEVEEAAERLLRYLVRVAGGDSRDVLKVNFEYVRAFLAQWGRAVALTGQELLIHLQPGKSTGQPLHKLTQTSLSRRIMFGLKLLATCLVYGQAPILLGTTAGGQLWRCVCDLLGSLRLGTRLADHVGQVVGLVMRYVTKQAATAGATESGKSPGLNCYQVEVDIKDLLRLTFSRAHYDVLLCLLDRASAYHPAIVDIGKVWLLDMVVRVEGRYKALALEVLRRRCTLLENLFTDVVRPDVMKSCADQPKYPAVQSKYLQLVSEMLLNQPREKAEEVLKHLVPIYLLHPLPQCRSQLFHIMRDVCQVWPASRPLLHVPLLVLLADQDSDLRAAVMQYWSSRINQGLEGRMKDMLRFPLEVGQVSPLSPQADPVFAPYQSQWAPLLETCWPAVWTSLMLDLPRSTPGFDRPIFDTSLADCPFIDLALDTGGVTSTLTSAPAASPLLSISQHMMTTLMTTSEEGGQQEARRGPPTKGVRRVVPGMVRATARSYSYAPTVSLSISPKPDEESLDGQDASTVDPSLMQQTARLQRRVYLRARSTSQRSHAIALAVMRRKAAQERQERERSRKIGLFRKYRKGELPDVQSVTLSGLLGPLSLLTSRDPGLGPLLLDTLMGTLMDRRAAGRVERQVVVEVKDHLRQCFQLRPRHPGYVRTLQLMSTRGRGGMVAPEDVRYAAQAAGGTHAAVMQLEEQIIYGEEEAPSLEDQKGEMQGSQQRQGNKRGRDDQSGDGGASTRQGPRGVGSTGHDPGPYLALADLYHQLHAQDLVDVIRNSHLVKCPGTRVATQAERQGLHGLALSYYQKLMDDVDEASDAPALFGSFGRPSSTEEELWYDEKMRCLMALGRWRNILEQVDTDLTPEDEDTGEGTHVALGPRELAQLFPPEGEDTAPSPSASPSPLNHHLRPYVRSCLFLELERPRLDQLLSLCEKKKSWMECLQQVAGVEMACYEVVRGGLEGTLASVNGVLKDLRSRWQALHPLANASRHHCLSLLQPLAEIHEVVSLLEGPKRGMLLNQHEVDKLLAKWWERSSSLLSASYVVDCEDMLTVLNVRLVLLDCVHRAMREADHKVSLHGFLSLAQGDLKLLTSRLLRHHGYLHTAEELLQDLAALRAGRYHQKNDDTVMMATWLIVDAIRGLKSLDDDRSHPEVLFVRDMLNTYYSHLQHNLNELKKLQGKGEHSRAKVQGTVAAACMQLAERPGVSDSMRTPYIQEAYVAHRNAAVCENHVAHTSHMCSHGQPTGPADQSLELQFGLFCYRLMEDTSLMGRTASGEMGLQRMIADDGGLPVLVVQHIIAAMCDGYLDSSSPRVYLPLVLAVMSGNEGACERFKEASSRVPLKVFLPWVSQMLARLDAPEGDVLLLVLEALISVFPQRLYFPICLSLSSKQIQGGKGRSRVQHLYEMVKEALRGVDMQGFAQALNCMTYPAQRWSSYEPLISGALSRGNIDEAARIYREAYLDLFYSHRPQTSDEADKELGRSAQGRSARQAETVNNRFTRKHQSAFNSAFGADGHLLRNMTGSVFQKKSAELIAEHRKEVSALHGKRDLDLFTPWFRAFTERGGVSAVSYADSTADLGGEGASFGSGSPGSPRRGTPSGALLLPMMCRVSDSHSDLHEQSVTVVGFGKLVDVYSSKQKPKRLTVMGSDFVSYQFVVKGGEDVRLDERVEQLFDVQNGLLDLTPACRSRYLRLRTYGVVPLSPRLGLLEYIKDTTPLESVLVPSFIKRETYEQVGQAYAKYIASHSTNPRQPPSPVEPYWSNFQRVSRQVAVSRFLSLQGSVRWDALREALIQVAASPEVFLRNRSTFTSALAVNSVFGYVAGVGDRHLQNFLLQPGAGELIPIDFGYSFGTGTMVLPIPELMPFRLTQQMRNVLQPHDMVKVLQPPMVATLVALQQHRPVLESILAIFLKEPLLDWGKEVQVLQGQAGDSATGKDGQEARHVSLKVEHTRKKLYGCHPSLITIEELRPRHSGRSHWEGLQIIVQGDPQHNVRARAPLDGQLTCQQVVECLLDQATDPNILGRTWEGWRPYI